MHVRNITQKVDIPNEPGQWAIIRKLSWKQLGDAREKRSDVTLDKMKRAGGDLLTTLDELQRRAKAEKQLATERVCSGLPLLDGANGTIVDEQEIAIAEPKPRVRLLDGFDLGTVLNYGVANLSYFEAFKKDDMNDLDEPTAEFIGEEILKLSGVGLTAADVKVDEKNG